MIMRILGYLSLSIFLENQIEWIVKTCLVNKIMNVNYNQLISINWLIDLLKIGIKQLMNESTRIIWWNWVDCFVNKIL